MLDQVARRTRLTLATKLATPPTRIHCHEHFTFTLREDGRVMIWGWGRSSRERKSDAVLIDRVWPVAGA